MIDRFLKLLLEVLGYLLTKYVKNAAAKQAYLTLIDELEEGGLKSQRLKNQYRVQLEAIKRTKTAQMTLFETKAGLEPFKK